MSFSVYKTAALPPFNLACEIRGATESFQTSAPVYIVQPPLCGGRREPLDPGLRLLAETGANGEVW